MAIFEKDIFVDILLVSIVAQVVLTWQYHQKQYLTSVFNRI